MQARASAAYVGDFAPTRLRLSLFLILASGLAAIGCHSQTTSASTSIEFTTVPQTGEGGAERITTIEGRVRGAQPGERIVVFTKTDRWWVQPFPEQPFTPIREDSTWRNSTHYGMEYAALLVGPGYRPPATTDFLPTKGGAVKAVAVVKGLPGPPSVDKTIHFSGYDWKARSASSNRGGSDQLYDPANAWSDESGAMHFRITMESGRWRCAEVNLTRSPGY